MSHLVSPCFANFPGGGAGVCACFVWVVFALVGCFLASREFLVISDSHQNSSS